MARGNRDWVDSGGHDGEEPALQQAMAWFIQLQDTAATEGDRQAFQAWYEADPAHRAAYRRVQAAWQAPELDQAARRLAADTDKRPSWRARRALALAASVLILLAGVGVYFDLPLRLRADHMTAVGEQRRVALADGSTVLLDTASAISVDMSDQQRAVSVLAGRAYFDVVKRPQRPFRVELGRATVEVTGTAFAVSRTGKTAAVALRRGSLRVRAGERSARLTPGQRVQVGADGLTSPAPVAFAETAIWVDGRLVFQDRPLDAVIDSLARYHPGLIVVADPSLGRVRVSGNYRLDDPVGTVAQLARLTGANLARVSDRLLILY